MEKQEKNKRVVKRMDHTNCMGTNGILLLTTCVTLGR